MASAYSVLEPIALMISSFNTAFVSFSSVSIF
jgi:hypothetical protein